MPAKDLGAKHICFKCSTKFYDLQKPVAICPKCGADQRESPALKAPPASEKRARAAARPVAPAVEEVETPEAEAEEEVDPDEDEDEADEAEDEP